MRGEGCAAHTVCGAAHGVCGVARGVCGAARGVGSVAREVCGVVRGVCGAARGVCGVVRGVCGAARGVCGAARGVCGVVRGVCGAARGVCCVARGVCGAVREVCCVTLRDPSRVTVAFEGRHGDETLLRPGIAVESAPIPARDPPYDVTPHAGSTVERHDSGGVAVRCPDCTDPQYRSMMGPDGYIELRGSPGHTLDWRPSGLAMRFDFAEMVPCRRGHLCERPNLSLLLETPADNVVSIHHQRRVARAHNEMSGARIDILVGVALAVVGLVVPFMAEQNVATN